MKSNYPRSVESPDTEAQPLVWPYSIGLGLVIVAIMAIESYWGRTSVFSSDSIPAEAAIIVFLSVIASGVLIVWKSSHWPVIAKAKLVAISSIGSWFVAVAYTLSKLGSMPQSTNNFLVLGVGLVTTVIMLTLTCIPIWLLGSMVRRIRKRRQTHLLKTTSLIAAEDKLLPTEPVLLEPEPAHVRTNA